MKKIVAIILVLSFMFVCVAEDKADTTPTLNEGEILMHGYLNPYTGYYIGVPADWAIIGAGSLEANLREASEMLENVDVYGLQKEMNAENDVLYCVSAKGEGLILTYGQCTGMTNDAMINSLDGLKKDIEAACPGVTFDAESGSYTFNSVYQILYVGMNFRGQNIRQYYIVSGERMFMLTFFGATKIIAETVLSTFKIQ